MRKLDQLRQQSADALSRRNEIGYEIVQAESKGDAALRARLERNYLEWQNRHADLEREIARLERDPR